MIPGGWGNVSRHWSAAHGPTRVITTDSKTEQSECDWTGTMFCPMAATDSNRHISQVNCLTCILYKWQLHVLDEWISYFYCQMLFKYMFHDVCLDSCSFTPNKCVCVLLWTARQHASHSLYMVTMWGANKVLRAALIWPSRQSQYPEVTTSILEGLLEGSPSHIIDCSKWTIWRRQNTYTHIFSAKASRWLWAVWAC